jgi:hypothetical protein
MNRWMVFWGILVVLAALPVCSAVSVSVDPHQIGQTGTVNVHYSGIPDGTNFSLRIQALMDVDPGSDFLFRAGNVTLPFDLGIVTFSVKNQNTAYNTIVLREWENDTGEALYNEITFEGPSVNGVFSKSAVSSNEEEAGDMWQIEDSSTALDTTNNVVFSAEISSPKTGGPAEGTFQVPILASNPARLKFTLIANGEVAESDEIVIGSPVSQSGRIYITTIPSGADVFIDGVWYGETPGMIVDVPPGQRVVTLTKEGYVQRQHTVYVQAQRITMLTGIRLSPDVPQTGSISVSSIPWSAVVYLDDQYKGLTPVTIQGVSLGTHSLKVTKDGYKDYTTSVTVPDGKMVKLSTIHLVRQTSSGTGSGVDLLNNVGLLRKITNGTTLPDAETLLQQASGHDSMGRHDFIQSALDRFRP